MLETNSNKTTQKVLMMAVLIIGLFLIGANQTMAQSRIFNFYIYNIDSAPVTITLETFGCYEGDKPNGEIFENVPPEGKVKILLARIQGNGCDGKAGYFHLIFSPKAGVKERVAFAFSNDGALWITPIANQYPGILGPKGGPSDQSYTYTTFARAKLTASKPQGSWDKLCAENCNEKYSEQITNETGSETTVSEETKSAISVALEAGLEFEGVGSTKTTVTASLEKTIGKSMSNRVMRSESKTKEKTVIYTPEQMNTFNIFAVWQWQAKTRLSNGQSYVVKTEEITCTSDGIEPNYLPGSKEHIGACRGKLVASAEKPQDATPKPTPVEAPKPIQAETPNPNSGRQVVDIEFTNSYSPIWNDSGSGANSQVSFWRPNITSGWSRVGHHISNGYGNPQESTMLVRPRTSGAISDPVDYTLVWNDAGSGASQDGSVWRPICNNGYRALGDVTSSSHAKPTTTEMVCVHESALVNANPGNPIWNDAGSGAKADFGSWEINPSAGDQSRGLFFGADSHSRPQITLWAVRSNAGATANPQNANPKPIQVETPKPTAAVSNRTDAEYLNLWAESNRIGLPKAVGAFQLTSSGSRCPSGCEESNGYTFLQLNFYMPNVQKESITIKQIEDNLKPILLPGLCSSEAPKRNIMIGVLVADMNKTQIGNFWIQGGECPAGNQ